MTVSTHVPWCRSCDGESSPPESVVGVPVACRRCGGPVRTLAQGLVVTGTATSMVLKCSVPSCGLEWLLEVFLRPVNVDHRYVNRAKRGSRQEVPV